MSKCPSCWNHAHQGNYIECPNVQTGQRREGNKINFSNVQADEVNGVMDWSLIVQKSKMLNSKALWNGHWLSVCPSCWGQRHYGMVIHCPNVPAAEVKDMKEIESNFQIIWLKDMKELGNDIESVIMYHYTKLRGEYFLSMIKTLFKYKRKEQKSEYWEPTNRFNKHKNGNDVKKDLRS